MQVSIQARVHVEGAEVEVMRQGVKHQLRGASCPEVTACWFYGAVHRAAAMARRDLEFACFDRIRGMQGDAEMGIGEEGGCARCMYSRLRRRLLYGAVFIGLIFALLKSNGSSEII